MAWQTNTIIPATTTPAADITKIKNDLAVLRDVIGGGTDADVPVGITAAIPRRRFVTATTTQAQIQTWLDADLDVDFGVPSFDLTSTLVIGGSTLRGYGGVAGKRMTALNVGGNFPAVQNRAGSFTSPRIEGLFINFGETVPPLDGTSDSKYGIAFVGAATWPEFARIENVIVRGARYGFFDNTGTYQTSLINVFVWNCAKGFTKYNGTTMLFENCFAQGGYQGWDVRDVIGVTMTNCAADQLAITSANSPNAAGCYFDGVHTLNITGWDAESNSVGPGCSYMRFDNCSGSVSVTGYLNTLVAGAGQESYLLRFGGTSTMALNARPVRTAAADLVYSGSGGAPYTVVAIGSAAKLSIIGSTISAATGGTPANAYAVVASSGADVTWHASTITGTVVGARELSARGTWTPTLVGATVSGSAPTVTGKWVRAGDMVHYWVEIFPAVGSTVAATAGSTYLSGVPVAATKTGTSSAVNTATAVGYGVSLVTPDRIYLPTIAATNNPTTVTASAYIGP